MKLCPHIPRRVEQWTNPETRRAEYSAFADNIWLGDRNTKAEAKALIRETIYEWLSAGLFDVPTPRYRRRAHSLTLLRRCSRTTTNTMRSNYRYERRHAAA